MPSLFAWASSLPLSLCLSCALVAHSLLTGTCFFELLRNHQNMQCGIETILLATEIRSLGVYYKRKQR